MNQRKNDQKVVNWNVQDVVLNMLNIDHLKYDDYKLKEQDFLKLISSCDITENDFDGIYGYIEDDFIFHYRKNSLMVKYNIIMNITLDENTIKKLFINRFNDIDIIHTLFL